MTHDYKRHDTPPCSPPSISLKQRPCPLHAAPSASGIHRLSQHRRAPADKAVHVVLDNYATHKHPKVRDWLARHPRFTFHFTPTSCSWANAVEGWFAKLTRQRLKRGVFTSIVEL
jgi:transposase